MLETAPGYLVSYRSYDGVRFSGQGEFKGDNKTYDRVAFNVWIKPSGDKTKTEKDDDKKPKAKLTIFDNKGSVIRTMQMKVDDGLNRLAWGLETDGQRFFSRNEPKEDEDLPGGYDVLPGTYKAVIALGDKKDSIEVEVKTDPRSKMTNEDIKLIQRALDDHNAIIKEAKTSFDKLKDAKKSISIVDKILENQPDSISKSFKTLHKNLNGQIDSLMNLFVGPEQQKGIQRNPDQLNSTLYQASSYIMSSWTAPGANALNAVAKAKWLTEKLVKSVDAFVEKEWNAYKTKASSLEVKIFKE